MSEVTNITPVFIGMDVRATESTTELKAASQVLEIEDEEYGELFALLPKNKSSCQGMNMMTCYYKDSFI
jgi:hypothetical protein